MSLDHLLGRPDTRFRKYQVFTVVLLWSMYLWKGNKHGPPFLRRLSTFFSKHLTPWQTIVMTFLGFYVSQNFANVVGLVSSEPLANMYTTDYFRATWITTALDASFWTCMNIRPIWLRDIASIIGTFYYLVCAEQADVKVKKVLGCINIDFMRTSWNKARTPYLRFVTDLMRPRFMRTKPRKIIINRPPWSEYTAPITAWLYFDGPVEHLKRHDKIILDIPGGGFVAMNPRCHDDKLLEWAGKTGLPVVALDYRKAPEYPYPYALHECYDAYCELVRSRGRCVGLAGDVAPKIVISGDSAGGNLAAGTVLMLLQDSINGPEDQIPVPEGLILIYPALQLDLSNWLSPEKLDLMKLSRKANKGFLDRKDEDFRKLQHRSTNASSVFDGVGSEAPKPRERASLSDFGQSVIKGTTRRDAAPLERMQSANSKRPFKTNLAMSSMISYFHDRVLAPELMRAMLLLYVGEHNQPDFATDYLLSPLLAPDDLLVGFPKVYILTGERDPLGDDSVLMAGRLQQAHKARLLERQEMGLEDAEKIFDPSEHVELVMIPGISHGFVQFVNIYPAGWKYVAMCRRSIMEIFGKADERTYAKVQRVATAPSSSEGYFDMKMKRDLRRGSVDDVGTEPSSPLEIASLPNKSLPALDTLTKQKEERKPNRTAQIYHSGRRSPGGSTAPLSALTSSENLINRRMDGLTMNLMGNARDDDKSSDV